MIFAAILSRMKRLLVLAAVAGTVCVGCLPHPDARKPAKHVAHAPKAYAGWRLQQDGDRCQLTDSRSGQTLWQGKGFCWNLWGEAGRPVALVARMETFSFGANVKLLRIGADGGPETLYDTTLAPAYGRLFAVLNRQGVRWSALTPQHDILIYAEPHDPPAEEAYLRLVALHLDSRRSWELGRAPWSVAQMTTDAAGEVAVLRDAGGGSRRLDIWGEGEIPAAAGPVEAFPAQPAADKSVLQLRSWRARGLIDADIYRRYRQRIAQP